MSKQLSSNKIIISNYDDKKNPFYGGGGAASIHEISKRVVKEHSVTVLTGNYPGAKNTRIDKVNYKRIGISFGGPFLGQIAFQLMLPFYTTTLKYDLWIESFTPPISTAFLQLFTKKPVIGLVHMLSGKDMERKYKLPFTQIENIGLKTYKNFIVMTKYIQNHISKINKSANIDVIPNGIELSKSRGKRNSKNQVLFLGRIEVNQKGLDLLLESFKVVAQKRNVDLVIAGTGIPRELKKLNILVNKLGLTDRVKMVGRVEGQEKLDLIKQSLFLAMPSRFETFGMSILEVFGMGKPVVVFDLEMLDWMGDGVALKAKAFSSQDYSEKLLSLIDNKKLRVKMGVRALKLASKYGWDNISKEYLNYINGILGSAKSLGVAPRAAYSTYR